MLLSTIGFACSLALSPSAAQDGWEQYNGANSARTGDGAIELGAWSEDGPKVTWRVPTDAGFSSFVVADGMAYTLVTRDGDEALVALDAASGKELWAQGMSGAEFDGGGGAGAEGNKGGDGPRTTPSVVDGRVYVFDAHLVLGCFDAKTGKAQWRVDVAKDHAGQELRWQNSASPVVADGKVVVMGGGAGQTFLAFDAASGELLWSSGDEKVTHATPTVATLHGKAQVLFFMQSGLVSCELATGKELWRAQYPYKISTAASPVVFDDMVYVSAGYGVGAGTFRIHEENGVFDAELLWQKRNKLMNHWSTPVCRDGYLYGMFSFKKYGEGPLCCVEMETGETMWSVPGFGPGNAIAVGDTLVALSDAGEIVFAELVPTGYQEQARAEVLEGKCWSSPSFADGQLYLRSTKEGVRIDLSEG
ncbi:MAG: outer membrane protein assembly factor BamB [Planctomycetota bacterium]|jgi:outer membrane protein assembly factor BamB